MPVTGYPQPVRDRILEHLKGRFEAIQQGVDEHVLTWNTVERRVLTATEQQVGNALAILSPAETKEEEVGYMRATLTVVTEFWVRSFLGEGLDAQATIILSEVYRTMREDIYCTVVPGDPNTQLTLNITEVRNEIDVEGVADGTIGGIIEWSILYRHHKQDSRKLVGE